MSDIFQGSLISDLPGPTPPPLHSHTSELHLRGGWDTDSGDEANDEEDDIPDDGTYDPTPNVGSWEEGIEDGLDDSPATPPDDVWDGVPNSGGGPGPGGLSDDDTGEVGDDEYDSSSGEDSEDNGGTYDMVPGELYGRVGSYYDESDAFEDDSGHVSYSSIASDD